MAKGGTKRKGMGPSTRDPTAKTYKAKADARTEVDPKLVAKYRVVRQADKKRDLFLQLKEQTKDAKRARRTNREKVRKTMKDKAPVKAVPKTKERMRKPDITIVDDVEDDEIKLDEKDDEFAKFYEERKNPKILITTCEKPSFRTKLFIKEALWLFPNSTFRPRKDYGLKEIIQFCKNRDFTDVIVITERLKQPFEMIISHLPEGPTATFRLSNFIMHSELEGKAERSKHYPELNLKNFDTRLGRRMARMFESLFPATRDYEGRAVATFHNQRDFIFVRVHRYVFDGMKEVRLQEMGPRVTLRLLSLQQGTFDTTFGEFEWFRKKEHDGDKLEWYL
jgi:ribosome production factor 1